MQTVVSLLDAMLVENIEVNSQTISLALQRCKTPGFSLIMLNALKQQGMVLDRKIFNTVFEHVDEDHLDDLLSLMESCEVKPNVATYNCIIYHCSYYDRAASYYDQMIEDNVRPNSVTYRNLLMKLRNNETETYRLLDEMVKHTVVPDNEVYYECIQNVTVTGFDRLKAVLEKHLENYEDNQYKESQKEPKPFKRNKKRLPL